MRVFGGKIIRIVVALMLMLSMAIVQENFSPCNVYAQTTMKKTAQSRRPKHNSASNSGSKSKSNSKSGSKTNSKAKGNSNSNDRQKRRANGPQTSAEARRLQAATQKEIQQTKEKIRLNEQQIKTGLSDLNVLSSEISSGRIQVKGLQQKVASLNTEISSLGEEIKKNEAELQLMRDEYLKAVKKMRLSKNNQSTLAFIFASENFNQAMRRIRYLRQFSAWKDKKGADISEKVAQLGRECERLAVAKDEQTVALGNLNKAQAELEVKHKKQEQLVSDLRENGNALQAHLVAKQNEANRLKETISSLIAQEQAKAEAERKAREKAEAERRAAEKLAAEKAAAEKAAAEKAAAEKSAAEKALADKGRKKKTQKPVKEKPVKSKEKEPKKIQEEPKKEIERRIDTHVEGSSFASLRGKLPRPVDGAWRITNAFGRHSMPELPEVVYDNPGIDAEVPIDTTVKSVYEGKVSGVYKLAGYGTVVIVNHGEYYTVYGNLSSANVAVGTPVRAGSKLGSAGHDPDDSRRGSVHFEVWKGREKQNPSSWLR